MFALEDVSGNGYVETGNEAVLAYEFSSGMNSVYSAAFGPFIKDFSAFPEGLMPGPFPAGITPYGSGCPLNGNGLSPVNEVRGGSPQVGNAAFEFGAMRLIPNQPSLLFQGLKRVVSSRPAATC